MSQTVDYKLRKQEKTAIERKLIEGLTDALSNRDVESFEYQLDMHIPELNRLYSNDFGLVTRNMKLKGFFGEMICMQDDRAQFVMPFLAKIPIFNEPLQQLKNQHPLHVAFQAEAFSVAEILLAIDGINVNAQFKRQTPLMLLIKKITSENFEAVKKMICLLALKGADINVNDNQAHPLSVICHLESIKINEKHLLLEFCKENFECDVDNFCNGQARKDIEELFKDLNFERKQPKLTTANLMFWLLKGKEEEFVLDFDKLYESLIKNNKEKDLHELMAEAVFKNRSRCVDRMFFKCKKEQVFETVDSKKMLSKAIKVVCHKGFAKVLKLFLKYVYHLKFFNESPLILTCVRRLQKRRSPEMYGCLDILLQSNAINVDKADHLGMTALHFAVQHEMDDVAFIIMTKGKPYLGRLNRFNRCPLHSMSATLLQRYLDWCITVEGVKSDDIGENIHINLKGFVHSIRKDRIEVRYVRNSTEETVKIKIFSNKGDCLPKALIKEPKRSDLLAESSVQQHVYREIDAFGYIADSKELRPLLKHPVIMSILIVKWFQIEKKLYFKLGLSVLITVLFTLYALTNHNTTSNLVFWYSCIAFVAIFAIIFLFINLKPNNRYSEKLSSFHVCINLLEWIILVLAIASLVYHSTTLLAMLIVLAGINIVNHLGSLLESSLSTSIVMLETVSRNFLKNLLIYVIILLAFGFGFFVLFSDSIESKADGDFNSFKTMESAIIKSLVMLTGELDAASIDFKSNRASYLLFLSFIFLVTLVIANLINGIAVSDISVIRQEAEVIALAKKIETLAHFETVDKRFKQNKLAFFSKYKPQLIVRPRENNKILVNVKKDTPGSDKEKEQAQAFFRWSLKKGERFLRLDEEIVIAMREIMDTKNSNNLGHFGLNLKLYDERFFQLEEKIDKLLRMSSMAGNAEPENASKKKWKKAGIAIIGQYRLRSKLKRNNSPKV